MTKLWFSHITFWKMTGLHINKIALNVQKLHLNELYFWSCMCESTNWLLLGNKSPFVCLRPFWWMSYFAEVIRCWKWKYHYQCRSFKFIGPWSPWMVHALHHLSVPGLHFSTCFPTTSILLRHQSCNAMWLWHDGERSTVGGLFVSALPQACV